MARRCARRSRRRDGERSGGTGTRRLQWRGRLRSEHRRADPREKLRTPDVGPVVQTGQPRRQGAPAIVRSPLAVDVPGRSPERRRARRAGDARRRPRRPEGGRARDPSVPRPPLRPRHGGRCRGRRRAAIRRHRPRGATRACWLAIRRTSSVWICPRSSPARNPTSGTGARPRPWPHGDPTGPSTRIRDLRSTSTSRRIACPGPTRSGPSAGSSQGCGSSRFGPGLGGPPPRAHARGSARGPIPAVARDGREHEPGRRPSTTTRPGRARRSWRRWPPASPPRT